MVKKKSTQSSKADKAVIDQDRVTTVRLDGPTGRWHPTIEVAIRGECDSLRIKEFEGGCGLGCIYSYLDISTIEIANKLLKTLFSFVGKKGTRSYCDNNEYVSAYDVGAVIFTAGQPYYDHPFVVAATAFGFKRVSTYTNLKHSSTYSQSLYLFKIE